MCVYRRILLTTKPIWFSFTGQLFIGPKRFHTYLGEGTTILPKEIALRKKIIQQNFFLNQRPLGEQPLVKYKAKSERKQHDINEHTNLTLICISNYKQLIRVWYILSQLVCLQLQFIINSIYTRYYCKLDLKLAFDNFVLTLFSKQ